MKIDRAEARRIAGLAHLEFDDAALDRIAGEMTEILGYIDMLRDATGGQISPALPTPMRDDAVTPSIDRDRVAANAPQWEDGFFVVPPVISDER